MIRFFYNVGVYAVTPLVVLYMLWRSVAQPAYLRRWRERYGFPQITPTPGGIWLHAVSVGEFQAAIPLVKALQEKYPQRCITITTMTPTGSERVVDVFGDSVHHCYLPYDYPYAVKRFLRRVKPDLALIVETEIWPNLFHQTEACGAPIIMASARLSPNSVSGYLRIPGPSLVKQTLQKVALIGAQGPTDVKRFRVLGAPAEKVEAIGNIKFDVAFDPELLNQGAALRMGWGERRPVFVAGSTHDGEEEAVLSAFDTLRERHPHMLLVLVPRHPQRFLTVAAALQKRNYRFVTRSSGEPCTAGTQIFLIDTLGELTLFYAAADVAFVGGSLVDVGGHNLLEPAMLGVPVLAGPQLANCEDIAQLMLERDALTIVQGSHDLASNVATLFDDATLRAEAGDRGRQMVAENRGAVSRLLSRIEQALSHKLEG